MIRQLTVERFKSIRSAKLDLGRVNILIGGNGAGKSNVLEAVGVLSAAVDRGLGDSDLSKKGVRLTPPELMKSAFKNFELPRTLQLTAKMEGDVNYRINLTGKEDDPLLAFLSESCIFQGKRVFGQGPNGAQVMGASIRGRLYQHRSIWDQVRTAFDFPTPVETALRGLAEYAIYSPQTDFLRGMQTGKVDTPPIGLHGEGLPQAVLGLIRQSTERIHNDESSDGEDNIETITDLKRRALRLAFLPKWANLVKVGRLEKHLISRAISTQGDEMVYFVDQFMHSKRRTLSVYDSSEGTLFLLFIAILLAHDDAPRIFSLDNVDNALNPGMTRLLLETAIHTTAVSSRQNLRCGPRQLFLTSHNPTSLDAFDLFDNDQRVFVVERNDEGHTVVNRLRPAEGMSREDWECAKNGRNLSQLWLDGEIRGALGGGM